MANRINYTIGYTVDKTGLQQLQSLFQTIAFQAQEPGNKLNVGLQQAGKTATQLDAILEKCYNQDLGTLNVTRFNQELKKANLTTSQIKADLAGAGATGAMAFNNLGSSILKTNIQLKQTNKLLDSMAVSMANTVKWGITSSIFNTVTSSISKSVNYSKQLDKSLNNIRIVTGKSKDEMAEFAIEANNAAKSLGASTLDYTNASLIYAQQGLSDAEIKARAEVTVKAANVTGQTGEEVSEQLTAVWNGYKVTAAETELYVDKLAAVAASTAADLEELSTGMSKVAAAANSMGVDIDQLNAQLATIVSVTRQAPESAGTALKTIYARMADLKLGETDEDGVGLGEVSAEMAKIGVNVLDANGNLKEMGDVVEEVAEKWDKLSNAQQVAIASAMAGKRQYNNLIALFDNWGMYTEALETSQNAMGTLQKQQDISLESTQAKLKELKATWEDLYGSLIKTDELNWGIDGLKNLVQVFDNFIDSFGGGLKAIGAFGAVVANIFNKQISNAIIRAQIEKQKFQNNIQVLEAQRNAVQQGMMQASGGQETLQSQANSIAYQKQLDLAKQIYAVRQGITSELYNEYMQEAAIVKEETEKATLLELHMKKRLESAGYQQEQIANLIKELGLYEGEYQKVNDIILLLDLQSDLAKEIEKIQKSKLSAEEKGKKIAAEILEINKNITSDYLEKYRLTTAGLTNVKDEAKLEQTIINLLQKINKLNQQDYKTTQAKSDALKFMSDNMEAYTVSQARATAGAAGLSQNIEQASKNLSVFKTVGTILPTISTLAMSWSSVSSVMQTLKDDTASFGDKITQLAMTAGMTIPMLIHSFSQLNSALGYTTTLSETWAALKTKHNVLDKAGISNAVFKSSLKKAENIDQATYNHLLERYAVLHQTEVSQLTREQQALVMVAAAKKQGIILTKEQALATLEAKGAQDALNTSMLANPWMWLIAGLGVLVAALSKASEAYKELREEEQKEIETKIENIETKQQEQKEVNGLVDNYLNLYHVYQKTGEATDELKQAAQAVIEALNLENVTVETLTGNYSLLTAKILEAQKASLNNQLNNANEALDEAEEGFTNEATSSGLTITGYKKYKYWDVDLGYTSLSGDDGDDELVDIIKTAMKEQGLSPDLLVQKSGGGANATIYNKEDRIAFFKALKSVYEQVDSKDFKDSEVYGSLKEIVNDTNLNKWYDKIIQQEGIVQDLENQIDIVDLVSDEDVLAIQNAADYKKIYNDLYEKLLQQSPNEDPEYLGIQAENYLASMLGTDAVSEYKNRLNAVNELTGVIVGHMAEKTSDDVINEYYNNNKPETGIMDAFKMPWDSEDEDSIKSRRVLYAMHLRESGDFEKRIMDQLNELSEEEFSMLMTLKVDEATSVKNLEDYIEIAKTKVAVQNLQITLEVIDSASETLLQNNQLTEDQIKELEKLEKQYPILQTIQDRSSKAYLEQLLAIQEALEEQEEILNKQIETAYITQAIDISINADESDFLEKMREIAEADYEVVISIKGDIQSNFDNVIATMTNIDTLAAKIGEDFIVAAEDIEELNDTFPGILEGVTFLADGTAQLNEEAVRSAMDAAKNEVTYDTQATIQKLQNDVIELESRRDAAREIARLAGEQVGKEQVSAEVESKIDNALSTLKSDNSTKVTNQEKEENQDVTDTAKMNAETMANNYAEAYQKMTKDSATWAEATKNNILYASTGGFFGKLTNGEDLFETGWAASKTGGTVSSAEKADLSTYEDYKDEDLDWGTIEEYYTNLADNYDTAKNNTEGKIAELMARNTKAIKSYENIEKGKGNDKDETDVELKKLEDEFDRYWDLNNAIDATSKALEDLSETQDKLTRGELQDNLKEQNELLEQQIVNYQNLRKEQEKEAGELKGKLLTFGVDFNADGSIANYAEATQEALNYYNNAAQRYNTGTISEEDFEMAEKSYEEFKETLERYDSLYYDEMVETAENIADTQREILENNLQDFELSITIKTDAAEFDREVKDFKTEIAKDFTKAFEDIDSVIEQSQFNVESYGESFNAVAAGISKVEEEILKLHNGENSNMFSSITEAQEKLKELNQEAMEHASNMKAAYEEAWEAYLEGIDQSQEKFDDLQEKYSKINEELEYQKELIELIYGPKAYDLMDKFYEKQKENSLSQIKSLQYEKELWLSKYDAEAAKAGDEDQLKIAERISQIQSDLNSNVTSYIQLLKDEYANTISGILSNFESQLTKGSSLDDIAEEWERLTENSDKYFNNVEGLYETQTLANKIKDSINDTISVKNQEKLQALYDREIEYLREKENLTQYDLDAAEARYQIALKEIALEEARENKNAMKLMRDTNGNWSYQYVADEDNIAAKQQELSDAMYKFYELSDKAYQENLESIQKLNQEYFDKAEEIATNELLTEQEKELKLEELRKWYLNQYQLLVSENEIIRQNLANGTVGVLNNLYNQDAANFENMTLQEQAALTQVKELGIASFAELEDKARQNIEGIGNSINIVAEQNIPEMTSKTQELADTWGADDGASVKAQSLDAFNSMMETSKQYQITLSEVAAAVKEDWGENGIAGAISNAAQYVIDLEEATKNLCNNTKTILATYKDNVDKISTSWGNVKTAIGDSIEQLNTLYELQGNPPKTSIPSGTAVQGGGGGFANVSNNVGSGTAAQSGGGGGGTTSSTPLDDNSSIVGYLLGADLQASPGGNRKYDLDNGREYGVKAYEYADYGNSPNTFYPIHVKLADDREGYVAPGSLYSLRWGKNGVPYRDKLVNTFSKVGSFDTGGYTGEWGSDGRMAMLHEKELVLNKEDTSNILAAVNGIRQLSSIESAISKGIASMIMSMTGMGVNVNYNTNEAKGNQTKQVFNIQAEFPNANSVDEIREAILSLPGLASQQAGLNFI